jgi:hypothetical protein
MRSASWNKVSEKTYEDPRVKNEAEHGIGRPIIIYPLIVVVGSIVMYFIFMALPVIVAELWPQ